MKEIVELKKEVERINEETKSKLVELVLTAGGSVVVAGVESSNAWHKFANAKEAKNMYAPEHFEELERGFLKEREKAIKRKIIEINNLASYATVILERDKVVLYSRIEGGVRLEISKGLFLDLTPERIDNHVLDAEFRTLSEGKINDKLRYGIIDITPHGVYLRYHNIENNVVTFHDVAKFESLDEIKKLSIAYLDSLVLREKCKWGAK